LMVVFSLIQGILGISSDNLPYAIFTYSALVPWTFFTNAVRASGSSIYTNAAILKKTAVPREIFPAADVLTSLFDFGMAGLVLLAMIIFYQTPITIHLLWLPMLIVLTSLLAWGIGLGIAALGTYRRDFIMGITFGIQLLSYATPIMYPLSNVPDRWRAFYVLNPLVGIIEAYRNILVRGLSPEYDLLFIAIIGTILVCTVTWPIFRVMSQYFADVL
jgi:lipopolysaccharide transport system permease protein